MASWEIPEPAMEVSMQKLSMWEVQLLWIHSCDAKGALGTKHDSGFKFWWSDAWPDTQDGCRRIHIDSWRACNVCWIKARSKMGPPVLHWSLIYKPTQLYPPSILVELSINPLNYLTGLSAASAILENVRNHELVPLKTPMPHPPNWVGC